MPPAQALIGRQGNCRYRCKLQGPHEPLEVRLAIFQLDNGQRGLLPVNRAIHGVSGAVSDHCGSGAQLLKRILDVEGYQIFSIHDEDSATSKHFRLPHEAA